MQQFHFFFPFLQFVSSLSSALPILLIRGKKVKGITAFGFLKGLLALVPCI